MLFMKLMFILLYHSYVFIYRQDFLLLFSCALSVASTAFTVSFYNNTILSCSFVLFLIIKLDFLIPAVMAKCF